jgi:hypothetical protein
LLLTKDATEAGGISPVGSLFTFEDVTVPNTAEETLPCLLCRTRAIKRVFRSSRHFIICSLEKMYIFEFD